MKLLRQIPNMLTLGNLLLGCLAIIYMFNDHMVIKIIKTGEVQVEMGMINISAYLIFLAAFIDFFDGFVARALGAQSKIGGELDSMADLVTFGLVPGLIMYQLLARSYYMSYDPFNFRNLFFAMGFLITLASAWRLAKFNLGENSSGGFQGIPTPASALFIASLPLILIHDTGIFAQLLSNKWVLFGITIITSYLMVSPLPMLKLKFGRPFSAYAWEIGGLIAGLLLLVILVFVFGMGYSALPICFVYYIVLSILHNQLKNAV